MRRCTRLNSESGFIRRCHTGSTLSVDSFDSAPSIAGSACAPHSRASPQAHQFCSNRGFPSGHDELIRLAVEEQQGVIHMLLVVAVIGAPFLIAIGGIVGAIGIDQDVDGAIGLLALGQIDTEECPGRPVAGLEVNGVLEAGERGLARSGSPGRRPQTSLRRRSDRKVSASF